MKQIFIYLNSALDDLKGDKHFKRFYLNNTAITQLEENIFHEITFEEIRIDGATELKHIHSNAFTTTNLITKTFHTSYSPIENSLPNYDLFHALSLMLNLESIVLDNTNIKEIPENAFKSLNGPQNKLWAVYVRYGILEKLGDYAFSDLNNLKQIALDGNELSYIPQNAFFFNKKSNETLEIWLNANQLNSSSIEFGTFLSIYGRPVTLNLYENPKITYLEEKIFRIFFEYNPENKIRFKAIKFDCNDCRSSWIKDYYNKFINRIDSLLCSNDKKFMDETNFVNCY